VFTVNGQAQLTTTSPKFGTASMVLDGTGDWIQTTSNRVNFRYGVDPFTIEMFIKPTAIGANGHVLVDFYLPAGVGSYKLGITSTGALQWTTSDGTNDVTLTSPAGVITAGVWQHVAVSRSAAGKLFLQRDGASVASTMDPTNYSNTSVAAFAIGAQANSRNANFDFAGSIDEVRVTKGFGRYTNAYAVPASAFTAGVGTVGSTVSVLEDLQVTLN
jgi:hypothetical protein